MVAIAVVMNSMASVARAAVVAPPAQPPPRVNETTFLVSPTDFPFAAVATEVSGRL